MSENEISNIVIGHASTFTQPWAQASWNQLTRNACIMIYCKADCMLKNKSQCPLFTKNIKLDHGYRMDLLIENKVVIEIKTIEAFTDVHTAQLLTYLRLGNFKLGLLINFHVSKLKHGIKRIIN